MKKELDFSKIPTDQLKEAVGYYIATVIHGGDDDGSGMAACVGVHCTTRCPLYADDCAKSTVNAQHHQLFKEELERRLEEPTIKTAEDALKVIEKAKKAILEAEKVLGDIKTPTMIPESERDMLPLEDLVRQLFAATRIDDDIEADNCADYLREEVLMTFYGRDIYERLREEK